MLVTTTSTYVRYERDLSLSLSLSCSGSGCSRIGEAGLSSPSPETRREGSLQAKKKRAPTTDNCVIHLQMSWVLLLIAVAATTSSTAHTTGFGASTFTAMNHGTFISSPSSVRWTTTTLTSSHAETSLVIMAAASPNQSLTNQILQGAARKLMLVMSGDDALDSVIYPPASQHSPREKVEQYTYYVREGHRLGERRQFLPSINIEQNISDSLLSTERN